MLAKEFSKVEKKLRVPGKSPGKLANFLRKVGKVPRKLADVFSQEHSAAPKLGETRFRLAFSSRNISRKKSKDTSSFRNMHEEKSKDTFSVGKKHPPAILHTYSVFVLKRRAFVRNTAGAVDNDDTVQRTAVVGREAGMARHPEIAMPACYGAPVSQNEMRRKNIQTPKPWAVAGR